MSDELVLDFGEMISKNDFKTEEVKQIEKLISKFRRELYAERDADVRTDMILRGLELVECWKDGEVVAAFKD